MFQISFLGLNICLPERVPVKAFPVKLEGLLEENLVLDRPLVGKRGEVGQVLEGFVQVVFVPEQHSQGLLGVVAVFLLTHLDVLLHWKKKESRLKENPQIS